MARKHPYALVHPFRITLVAFIDDLNNLEEHGLAPEQCNSVLDCLDSIIMHLRKPTASSSFWLRELLVPFSSLRAEYFTWNNPKDGAHPPSHRARQCRLIRRQKDGMLPRFKYGPLFASEEERAVFMEAYDEFIKLEGIAANSPRRPFKKTAERAREKRAAIA
jgi:hypothetical protein